MVENLIIAHLRAISTVLYVINAVGLLAVGLVARSTLGGLMPALLVQAGPFASTVIARHGLYVKPETFLVFTALMLAFVTLMALRPGALEKRPTVFAVMFGIAAGLGVATKLSAAPLYVLPVFLLWGLRPLVIYGAVSAVTFVVLTLPIIGAYGEMASWIGQLAMGSGHFGGGERTFIDMEKYPRDVMRMLSRPVLLVPIVLAPIVLLEAWRRGRKGQEIPRMTMRALGGVALAQVVHILIVAKHPDAHYLIPNLVLSGLTVALIYRVVSRLANVSPRARFWSREVVAVVFGVYLLVQGAAIVAQDFELREWRADAESVDNTKFGQCAQVYFQFASDPTYALLLSDYILEGRLADRIAPHVAPNELWFDVVSGTFRDLFGETDMLDALAEYPCAFFRGQDRGIMETYLDKNVPGITFSDACSTDIETVLTSGVDCQGKLTGK
ncbi:MAG: hypothetical protein H8E94_07490 [Alphaproteobacteria bacterium]|nr:hypothetical protein [Alphaproteobacteria bacterium]